MIRLLTSSPSDQASYLIKNNALLGLKNAALQDQFCSANRPWATIVGHLLAPTHILSPLWLTLQPQSIDLLTSSHCDCRSHDRILWWCFLLFVVSLNHCLSLHMIQCSKECLLKHHRVCYSNIRLITFCQIWNVSHLTTPPSNSPLPPYSSRCFTKYYIKICKKRSILCQLIYKHFNTKGKSCLLTLLKILI